MPDIAKNIIAALIVFVLITCAAVNLFTEEVENPSKQSGISITQSWKLYKETDSYKETR